MATITIADIYAALIAEQGHRGRAAERLGMPLRTLHGRLREGGEVVKERLASLAREHAWPSPTAAAHEAARASYAARRAARLAGA